MHPVLVLNPTWARILPCQRHLKRCLKGDLHQKRGKRGGEATPGLVPAGPPPVSTTGRWSRAAPGEGAGLHSGQVARGASPFHAPLALSKLWPHRRPGLLRQQDADVHAPRGPDDSVRGLHAARGPENGIAPSRARSTPRGAWQVTSRPLLSERRHRTSRRGPPGAQHTGATRRTPHQPGEERGRSLMSPGCLPRCLRHDEDRQVWVYSGATTPPETRLPSFTRCTQRPFSSRGTGVELGSSFL